MSHSVFLLMEEKRSSFSKGQNRIAKYITEQYDKAAFMTACKLGKAVGVSESTVVRFAMQLGFKGYPQLQRALQEMIRNRLTAVQRIEVASQRLGETDILEKVLTGDMENIRLSMEALSKPVFYKAVEAINKASKIYILGIRSSASLASFLSFYYSLAFDNVHLLDPAYSVEVFEQMLHMTKEDVLIAISFPRYSRETVKALQFAKHVGAGIIAITDNASSPIAAYATHILTAQSDMVSFVDSLVAPLSLINALIVATTLSRRDELSAKFCELESIWEAYDVYEKSESEI